MSRLPTELLHHPRLLVKFHGIQEPAFGTISTAPFSGVGILELKLKICCLLLVCIIMETSIPLPKIALPGQPLGPLSSYVPGPGAHLPPSHQNPSPSSILHASILGPTVTSPTPKGPPTLSISRQQSPNQQPQTSLLPKEGNIILGRVTRINIREARVQILVIGDVPVLEEFTGVIR